MKKGLKIAAVIAAIGLIVAFSGLMQSLVPQHASAGAMNAENLIFSYIPSADTTDDGDSALTVSGITASDEVRLALKFMKYVPQSGDSSYWIMDYTDSVTLGSGTVTPAYWTYGDNYLIIWRDLNQ